MLSPGEWLTAQGRWVQDREFGLQFKAEMLTSTAPTTKEGIEKYLGSGMVKGIGPVYAKKLVASASAFHGVGKCTPAFRTTLLDVLILLACRLRGHFPPAMLRDCPPAQDQAVRESLREKLPCSARAPRKRP